MAKVRGKPILIERGILLNFYKSPFYALHPFRDELVLYQGPEWRFHSMKPLAMDLTPAVIKRVGPDLHDEIQNALTARNAKEAGHFIKPFNSKYWDTISFRIMLEANMLKFTQNDIARRALLDTGRRPLVEHRRDKIWGDNLDGSGKNWQGQILMRVRDAIRAGKFLT